ncbi:MAG TPA: phytoene/squalene synthase family protein [Candidatus Acidoferrales bacterium]|nr:phytoene/squalene synthase family protein [Candidatus Acidoferrales bacterium]
MITVEESYQYCLKVARTRAKNFYYSFVLLSRQQRKAMCAIYAFMRYCDDLSDEPGASRAAVDRWRAELTEALEGRFSEHPVWPAFHHTVRRFGIPHEYFHQMIDGIASDLEPKRIETFEELYGYCYRVASVVGLTIIHIFGFDTRSALPLAEKCGVAFQLTNILRDIREDAERGRIYIPADDLRRFGVTEEDLRAGRRDEAFLRLMRFEAARARAYYNESAPLLELIHPRSRSSLLALVSIYSRLLERIEGKNYDVFSSRVRLSLFEKSWIVVRAMVG